MVKYSTGESHPDWAVLLEGVSRFSVAWLQDKQVAPVPVGRYLDPGFTRRIASGCRAVDASYMLCASLKGRAGESAAKVAEFPLVFDPQKALPPCLIYTPNLQGAILFPEKGYALIGGTPRFLRGALNEGAAEARARFARYARSLAKQHPRLSAIAAEYPSRYRAWSLRTEVEHGSTTERQLELLAGFTNGELTAPEFAQEWWKAQRESKAHGERIRGKLKELFDETFMILEDYSIDPEFREPGDLSDTELQVAVRTLLNGE